MLLHRVVSSASLCTMGPLSVFSIRPLSVNHRDRNFFDGDRHHGSRLGRALASAPRRHDRRGMTRYVRIAKAKGTTVTASMVSRTPLVKSQPRLSPEAC